MTRDQWLEAHPYLRPLAELSAQVEHALNQIEVVAAPVPDWDLYRDDFLAGMPLLSSAEAAVDLGPAGRIAAALVEQLASGTSPEWLVAETRALHTDLNRLPNVPDRIADVLHGEEIRELPFAGLLRYLSWTAAAQFLRPVVSAFGAWRDEDRWIRRYCPTCGSLPAMAQLTGADPGRKRMLSCGCCGTRWQFKRTMCPLCDADSQRLASLAIDGEPRLRIDHCESCRGYLKTYNGEGDEDLLLADWSSVHLDLIAHDRGLKRLAASLFAFDPVGSEDPTPRTTGDPDATCERDSIAPKL
jgi:FdhE protein